LFDLFAFIRIVGFAVLFGCLEYRYIYRREAPWTKEVEGFNEEPAFWIIGPYQAYLVLPAFVVVALSPSITAWAGNAFLVAFLEDVAYFVWRGTWVRSGEWTTRLFGTFTVAGKVFPAWWPMAFAVAVAFYLMPL
jgi:hypothetical protein